MSYTALQLYLLESCRPVYHWMVWPGKVEKPLNAVMFRSQTIHMPTSKTTNISKWTLNGIKQLTYWYENHFSPFWTVSHSDIYHHYQQQSPAFPYCFMIPLSLTIPTHTTHYIFGIHAILLFYNHHTLLYMNLTYLYLYITPEYKRIIVNE